MTQTLIYDCPCKDCMTKVSITVGNAEALEKAVNSMYKSHDNKKIRVTDVRFPASNMCVVFYEDVSPFKVARGRMA